MQKKPAVHNVDTLLGEIRQWVRDRDTVIDVLYREAELSEAWSLRLTRVTYTLTQFCDLAEHEQRLAEHFVSQSKLAFAESRAFYVALGDRDPHLLYDDMTSLPLSQTNHAIFITPQTTTTTTTNPLPPSCSIEQEGIFARLQASLFYASERHNELIDKHEAEDKYRCALTQLADLRVELAIPATAQILTRETRQRLALIFDEPTELIEKMRLTLATLATEKSNLFVYLANTMLIFARCSAAFHKSQKQRQQQKPKTNHLRSMYEELPVLVLVPEQPLPLPGDGREKSEQIARK